METKMDSEHISLINYRKEENAKKKSIEESSINTSDTDDFSCCDLCRYKCKKKCF